LLNDLLIAGLTRGFGLRWNHESIATSFSPTKFEKKNKFCDTVSLRPKKLWIDCQTDCCSIKVFHFIAYRVYGFSTVLRGVSVKQTIHWYGSICELRERPKLQVIILQVPQVHNVLGRRNTFDVPARTFTYRLTQDTRR
jgi:hypothetical protein